MSVIAERRLTQPHQANECKPGRPSKILILHALSGDSAFEGARTVSRISGCDLGAARARMSELPGLLDIPLYSHQAERIPHRLTRIAFAHQISR